MSESERTTKSITAKLVTSQSRIEELSGELRKCQAENSTLTQRNSALNRMLEIEKVENAAGLTERDNQVHDMTPQLDCSHRK